MACETLGGTLNWLQGNGDPFAQKSTGHKLQVLSGMLMLPGVFIMAAGVGSGLLG